MLYNCVSNLRTGLMTAIRPLAEAIQQHPATTLGVILLFTLLALMLSDEIAEGQADAARVDEVPPFV